MKRYNNGPSDSDAAAYLALPAYLHELANSNLRGNWWCRVPIDGDPYLLQVSPWVSFGNKAAIPASYQNVLFLCAEYITWPRFQAALERTFKASDFGASSAPKHLTNAAGATKHDTIPFLDSIHYKISKELEEHSHLDGNGDSYVSYDDVFKLSMMTDNELIASATSKTLLGASFEILKEEFKKWKQEFHPGLQDIRLLKETDCFADEFDRPSIGVSELYQFSGVYGAFLSEDAYSAFNKKMLATVRRTYSDTARPANTKSLKHLGQIDLREGLFELYHIEEDLTKEETATCSYDWGQSWILNANSETVNPTTEEYFTEQLSILDAIDNYSTRSF